jgi:RimJ/RimL family protein N-acetyltransferase
MAAQKEVVLKTGETITLKNLSPKNSAREMMDFINALVESKAMIAMDKRISLKEEKVWLKGCLHGMKKGDYLNIIASHKGKVIGSATAERERYKLRNNVLLGIAILPYFQGKGLGSILMKELIGRTKKEMGPKNIFLTVLDLNKKAYRLYEELGFRTHHVLPKWANHYGKWCDLRFMILGRNHA